MLLSICYLFLYLNVSFILYWSHIDLYTSECQGLCPLLIHWNILLLQVQKGGINEHWSSLHRSEVPWTTRFVGGMQEDDHCHWKYIAVTAFLQAATSSVWSHIHVYDGLEDSLNVLLALVNALQKLCIKLSCGTTCWDSSHNYWKTKSDFIFTGRCLFHWELRNEISPIDVNFKKRYLVLFLEEAQCSYHSFIYIYIYFFFFWGGGRGGYRRGYNSDLKFEVMMTNPDYLSILRSERHK